MSGDQDDIYVFACTNLPAGLERRDDGMVRLTISIADMDAFDQLDQLEHGQVVGDAGIIATDLASGTTWELRRSTCALFSCGCAATGWWLAADADLVNEFFGLTSSSTSTD